MGKPISHILVYIIRIVQIFASLGEIGLAILVIVTYNGLPVSSTDPWTDPQGTFFVPFICYVCLSGLCIIRIILSFLVNTHRSMDPSLDEMLFLAWSGLWFIGAIAARIANGGFSGCCRQKRNKVNNMPALPPPVVQNMVSIPESVEPESAVRIKPQQQQQQQQQQQVQYPQPSQSLSWHQQPQVYQQRQSQRYQQLPRNSYMPTPQQTHYSAQTQSLVYTTTQPTHTIQHSPKGAYMLSSAAQAAYTPSSQATTSYRPPTFQPSVFVNNMAESEKIAVEDESEKTEYIGETAAVEIKPIISPQYH